MKTFYTMAIMAMLTTLSLHAQTPGNSFVINHVTLFDGEQVYSDRSVVVRNGMIDSVTTEEPVEGDLPIIDGHGATLMPGLINAHAHTREPAQLTQSLLFGVTTVLDLATFTSVDKLREAANTHDDVADFLSANTLATPPGGHGTEYGFDIRTVKGPDDAEAFVAEQKSQGANFLKIVLNGVRAERNGTPTLDSATVKALVLAGHARSMIVVAHIESPEDAVTAVEAGVDGLAHIWRNSADEPEVARLIASHDVFVIPTLSVQDGFVDAAGGTLLVEDDRLRPYLSETLREFLTTRKGGPKFENIDQPIEAVGGLYRAGVKLLAGPDQPNGRTAHGVSMHRELELLVMAGLKPIEALAAGTANVADAYRLSDRGRIEKGLRADLMLVKGDPTVDITATRDIVRIWKAGVEFDRQPFAVNEGH